MNRLLCVIIAIICNTSAIVARADLVTITNLTPGLGTITNQQVVVTGLPNNAIDIFLTTSGSPSILIQANGSPTYAVPINGILVDPNGTSNTVVLSIESNGANRIRSIDWIGEYQGDGIPNGKMIVTNVEIEGNPDDTSGHLGENLYGNWTNPGISTSVIGNVDAQGSIYGRIQATAANGSITRMSAGHDLLCTSISAPTSIGEIDVAGTIGTSSSLVPITAGTRINSIDASDIHATIAVTGASGFVRRIRTTSGTFRGSLAVAELTSTGAIETDGVRVSGLLDANITVSGASREPITAAGVAAGRTISIGGALIDDGSPTGDSNGRINIAGAMAGTIISQSIQGPITIQSNLTGLLQSSGNCTHPITIAGFLSGDIEIGGSLTGPVSVNGSVTLSGSITSTGVFGGASNTITIGGSLAGTITLPAGGLVGQVIVNANNGSGTWTGAVTVGGTSLTPRPVYTQTSASLGGGAVGLL